LNFFRRLLTGYQKIEAENCPLTKSCEWIDGWVGGCKSSFMDCLQQSKNLLDFGRYKIAKLLVIYIFKIPD
jgi:hypothetical protein